MPNEVPEGYEIRYTEDNLPYYQKIENIPVETLDDDPFARAAARVRRSVKGGRLPIEGPPAPVQPPSYLIEPDLLEAQQGQHLPTGIAINDAGIPFNLKTGVELPTVPRPNVLPVAKTPEGLTFAMPKMLDIVGNVMGNVAAPAVATKAGEVVLGSGAVRTAQDIKYPLAKPTERWTNTLGQNDNLMQTMTPDEFLNKSRPLKIDVESRETIDALKRHIEEGKPLDPLELHANGKEDGRHRAIAAKELGISEVPVLNFRKEATPFYSALERAVDSAKLSKGDAQQWLGYLKNQPGVKSEELNYVLGDLKGQLTKAEVQDIVKQNKVGFEEKVLGYDKNAVAQGLGNTNSPTKYHQYQLPGGENYQELLLTLPDTKYKRAEEIIVAVGRNYQEGLDLQKKYNMTYGQALMTQADKEYGRSVYKSSHFGDDGTNLLAHVRYNDRRILEGGKPEGDRKVISDWPVEKKVLHIEEIQSDWHQAGRKQGYIQKDLKELQKNATGVDEKLIAAKAEDIMANPDLKEGLKQAVERKIITQKEADDYLRLAENEHSTVPDAPFKKNWDELALKRMLHKAANEGYDAVSWTPGEAQALRYQNEIRRKLDGIDYIKQKGDERLINIQPTDGTDFNIRVDKQGTIIEGHPELKGKKLDDTIGKDLAKQIMEGNDGHINTKGYVMGAEGMKGFYDKMLVDKANALGKKYGSKVESREIPTNKGSYKYIGPDKTLEELSEARKHKGLTSSEMSNVYDIINNMQNEHMTFNQAMSKFGNKRLAERFGGELKPFIEKQPIHYLKITPELRAKAKEGFPLFSSTPILNPVDYDPWEKQDKAKRKISLIPVDYDPFK